MFNIALIRCAVVICLGDLQIISPQYKRGMGLCSIIFLEFDVDELGIELASTCIDKLFHPLLMVLFVDIFPNASIKVYSPIFCDLI